MLRLKAKGPLAGPGHAGHKKAGRQDFFVRGAAVYSSSGGWDYRIRK